MPVAEVKAGLARPSRPEPTPALIERVPTTRDKPTQCASLPSRRSRGGGVRQGCGETGTFRPPE